MNEIVKPVPPDASIVLEAGKQLGLRVGEVRYVQNLHRRLIPYTVVPKDAAVVSLGEFIREQPVRIEEVVTLIEAASFITYVKRFALPESIIFADLQARKLVAVFDYHGAPDVARWGKHSAVLGLRHPQPWLEWTAASGKPVDQATFAMFIEDHLPDIIEPAGARVLEMALQLQAKKDVSFASGLRLVDGEHQLAYEERIDASAAKGTMKIPDKLQLALAVFEGGESYRVDARFRYRIKDGRLAMWVDLWRTDAIVEDAFRGVCVHVAEMTGLPLLFGARGGAQE